MGKIQWDKSVYSRVLAWCFAYYIEGSNSCSGETDSREKLSRTYELCLPRKGVIIQVNTFKGDREVYNFPTCENDMCIHTEAWNYQDYSGNLKSVGSSGVMDTWI